MSAPLPARTLPLPAPRDAAPRASSWLAARAAPAEVEDVVGDPIGADLADPPLRVKDLNHGYGLGEFSGPLFINGPSEV